MDELITTIQISIGKICKPVYKPPCTRVHACVRAYMFCECVWVGVCASETVQTGNLKLQALW